MKTFKCRFGKKVSCEIKVCDDPPERGKCHIQAYIWEGIPNKKHLRQYIRWINTINAQLADEWGLRIMHVFPTPGEVWVYDPGTPPKRIEP